MQLHIGQVLAATAVATCLVAQAAAQSPPPADAPQVYAYGNWLVRQDVASNAYLLVGQATSEPGQVWLQCDQRGLLTVFVPMFGKGTNEDKARSQTIRIRSDDAQPRTFGFIVFQNFVAMAMEPPEKQSRTDEVSIFVNTMGEAKRVFALTYDQTTFEFDVAQFGAARSRFQELCNRTGAR